MGYRTYSKETKNRALEILFLVNGGNVSKTSRDLGIPYSTLYGWAEDAEGHEDLGEQSKVVVQRILESMPETFSEHGWPNALREAIKAHQMLTQGGSEPERKPVREQVESWIARMDAETMAGVFFRKIGWSPGDGKTKDPIEALLQGGKAKQQKEDKKAIREREIRKILENVQ